MECDNFEVVHLFQDNLIGSRVSPLLQQCQILLTSFEEVCINHIFREANQVADSLAKFANGNLKGIRFLDEVPDSVSRCFQFDVMGLGHR